MRVRYAEREKGQTGRDREERGVTDKERKRWDGGRDSREGGGKE